MKKKILFIVAFIFMAISRLFAEEEPDLMLLYDCTGGNFCLFERDNETYQLSFFEYLYPTTNCEGKTYINGVLPEQDYCYFDILTITDTTSFVTRYKVKKGDVLKFFYKKKTSSYYYIEEVYIKVNAYDRNKIELSITDSDSFSM